MEFENTIICGDWIMELKKLPDNIFHCCVTSPPYWGQRDYGWGGDGSCYDKKKKAEIHPEYITHPKYDYLQICPKCGRCRPKFGLEKTPEEHIEKLVEGFREVRRVLRPDGVLWLNYGDKYASIGRSVRHESPGVGAKQEMDRVERDIVWKAGGGSNFSWQLPGGQKQGDLLMLPARVALALQADGWILRDDITWAKAISSFGMHVCPHCGKELYQQIGQGNDLFGDTIENEIVNHKKSGSTMPESVNGTRWERHRVKVKAGWGKDNPHPSNGYAGKSRIENSGGEFTAKAEYIDCPGCPKCEPNGGLVLRRGSWRCTKAHEHIFQFTKTNNYFCDMEAVKEGRTGDSMYPGNKPAKVGPQGSSVQRRHPAEAAKREDMRAWGSESGRNLRNVWIINPRGYKEAHYAT